MSLLDRISINEDVRFGKPWARGTRITVGDVLSYLAAGLTEDRLLAEFAQLTREDVRACLAYAAERERRVLTLPAARAGDALPLRLASLDSAFESRGRRSLGGSLPQGAHLPATHLGCAPTAYSDPAGDLTTGHWLLATGH